MHHRLLTLCLLAVLTLCASSAVILDVQAGVPKDLDAAKAEAKELANVAFSLLSKSMYQDALALFEKAYSRAPSPLIRFYIGKCHEELANLLEARRHYRDVLQQTTVSATPGPVAMQAKQLAVQGLERIEERLPRVNLSVVGASLEQVRFFVDGKEQPSLRIAVDPGAHVLLVTVPDNKKELSLVAIEGKVHTLRVRLGEQISENGVSIPRGVLGSVSLAATVASFSVATWAAFEVASLQDDDGLQSYRSAFTTSDDVCDEARSGVDVRDVYPGASSPDEAAALCDEADTLAIVQAVGYPAAIATLGLGLYLMTTAFPDTDDAETAARVQPVIVPGFAGLSVRGNF